MDAQDVLVEFTEPPWLRSDLTQHVIEQLAKGELVYIIGTHRHDPAEMGRQILSLIREFAEEADSALK